MLTKHKIPVADRAKLLIGSVIDASTALLAEQKHDIVRFAMGAPGEDLMPLEALDEAFAATRPGRYDYGESEGEPRLRAQIAKLAANEGNAVNDERILVTTGGMQGLDLAFKIFVDPGDLVVIEEPTYTNGHATAMSYGADILAIPVDSEGMRVEELAELVEKTGKTPKVIYTIPNFQNPTGVTLSEERKIKLVALAEKWDAMIIDDDPYGALRFGGERVPGFTDLFPEHTLIFKVRTFSKTMAPGLRVGWIEADPAVIQLAVNAKQAMDTCSGMPAQHAVAHFLEGGHLEEHIARLLPLYKERKQAMLKSLEKHFGNRVHATDPDGGFFLWLTLKEDLANLDTEKLFEKALADGVAYIPGPAFTADGSLRNALRLCFATSSPERIEEGISRLAKTFNEAVRG